MIMYIYMQKLKPLSHNFSLEHLPAVVPHYYLPSFSRDFTTNLTLQCRRLAGLEKIEELNATLFPGPRGSVDTNDWCIMQAGYYRIPFQR